MLMRREWALRATEADDDFATLVGGMDPYLSDAERFAAVQDLAMASREVMADSQKSGWICLQVVGGRERAVRGLLIRADIEYFLPIGADEIVIRRGRKWTVPGRSLIGQYVFVRCAASPYAWRGLAALKDVIALVGGNDHPILLGDKAINDYKELTSNWKRESEPPEELFEVGHGVFVALGPWAGFQGVITWMPKRKARHCRVEVSANGRKSDITIPLAHLLKL